MPVFFPQCLVDPINIIDERFLAHGQTAMCYPLKPWAISRQVIMKTLRLPFVPNTVHDAVVVNRVRIGTSEIPQTVRVV